jgi:chloramphenicol-sensitive protein RarD
VVLAGAGVLVLVIARGAPPWIALAMAATWGGYAVVRKTTPVDAFTGLLVETVVLLPLALIYLFYQAHNGVPVFGLGRTIDYALLLNCGTITIAPLILFNAASRRLPLSTVGIINYIAPTLQFIVAVWWFDEIFTLAEAITFSLIWISLALYTIELRRGQSLKPA